MPRSRNPQSHAAILDATIEQLLDVGYVQLTIEGVAARAHVGKGTVYRWWPSKVRLVVEALSKRCELRPVTSSGDPRTDVRAVVKSVVEIMAKTPLGSAFPQLVDDFDEDPQARVDWLAWLGPTRASHLALLCTAADRSALGFDLDPDFVLDLAVGMTIYRTLLGSPPDDQLVDQLTEFIAQRSVPRASSELNQLV